MKGPFRMDEDRRLSSIEPIWTGDCMKRGKRYRVTMTFRDGDGDEHPVGEEWLFIGSTYSIYDNLRTLYVSFEPNEHWEFPLFTDPGRQKDLEENFGAHVQALHDSSLESSSLGSV